MQASDPVDLHARYLQVRVRTTALAASLSAEDCQVQSMPDASPAKWHLAHVTWFFETFVLERFEPDFQPFNPAFRVLFNSYYNAVGDKYPRAQRGLVSRPALAEVLAWRAQVDARMARLLAGPVAHELSELVELGLQHEQQHQELLLTDIKHLLSCNPLAPAYQPRPPDAPARAGLPLAWKGFEGGLIEIGHAGGGFAFENETPRHKVWLEPFELAMRLVTQGEFVAFMADGGYRDPRWWLSAGWDWVQSGARQAPLYWRRSAVDADDWQVFTLHGLAPLDATTPVEHLSYFEADAFARWAGARLPTEAEWEYAATSAGTVAGSRDRPGDGSAWANLADGGAFHPLPAAAEPAEGLQQLFGDVWEWTSSPYTPYPGYRPWAGAVGEYNGKFMCNQYVLRGGSCVTPADHIRASYRNFFPAESCWQFTGLRLARDLPRR
jgi:ergothioneine biosynthesis protein EgtB